MRNFENAVIIYPEDPTIGFLNPLFEGITELLPNIAIHRPKHGDSLHTMVDDDTQLVIFIGHGTPSGLYGGVNGLGKKQLLCDISSGALLLQDCSIVLFSCNSDDYLKKLQKNAVEINNYIVFGDMPTDWEHIRHNRDNISDYWSNCDDDQLEYYKTAIVDAVLVGFRQAYKTSSFHGLYKGIEYVVNVRINDIIIHENWTKDVKIQLIERLTEFKKDIKYTVQL